MLYAATRDAATKDAMDACADTRYDYQVGGSLRLESPSYIQRQADVDLLQQLMAGEYCYVFNSRQMGKSSLRIRVQQQLRAAGKLCATIDMTSIGSEGVTPSQWYKGLMVDLLSKFELRDRVDFKQWWQVHEPLSLVQRLRLFIEDILLRNLPDQDLLICVDEIDSALVLAFPIDDFFALVRYCYNQRSEDAAYNRLTWALFGVVTPSELICDQMRSPFNIGQAIELRGFTAQDAAPLASGLAGCGYDPHALIEVILMWTSGQPFLTQKVCRLVRQALCGELLLIDQLGRPVKRLPAQSEALVQAVIYQQIIEHWETRDEPEHLRTIRDRLLRQELQAPRLLGIYETVLAEAPARCDISCDVERNAVAEDQRSAVKTEKPKAINSKTTKSNDLERLLAYDDSPEHIELLLSGLIENTQGWLQVKNQIYQAIFDLDWVQQQLRNLRPYARQLTAWVNSERTDESRLLRGKALDDAQAWSQKRSVSEVDHAFLMASEQYDSQITQQRLKSARLKAVEKRFESERRARRRQRTLIAALSGALVVAVTLAAFAYRKNQLAQRQEIQAIITTAEALYSSDQRLDALLESIKAERRLKTLGPSVPETLIKRLDAVLRISAVNAVERNRLTLVDSNFWDVAISPNGLQVATGSADNLVRLWQANGEPIKAFTGHQARVRTVDFFPDGRHLISAGDDRFIKIWTLDGESIRTLRGHTDTIYDGAIAPDGNRLASASGERTVKLWQPDGTLLKTLQGFDGEMLTVAFSPEGNLLATAGEDRVIKLWALNGKSAQAPSDQSLGKKAEGKAPSFEMRPIKTLQGHTDAIVSVAFSLSGQKLAAASRDSNISYWDIPTGKKLYDIKGHQGDVLDVTFSPDGKQLASTGRDNTVRLWNLEGQPLATLQGHQSRVNAVHFAPGSEQVWSAGSDRTVRQWDLTNPLRTVYTGPSKGIIGTDISPDGQLIAAASDDHDLYIWNRKSGRLIERITHPKAVLSAAFSPDGKTIVTGSWDGIARLWTIDGKPLATLDGHNRKAVWDAVFSPDGQTIATGSIDGKVQLWDLQGNSQKIIAAHKGEVRSVAYSADGRFLLSASLDNTVKLWRLSDGALVEILRGNRLSGFIDANFSPDGQLIAAAGFDDLVRIWTVEGQPVAVLQGHEAEVRSVSFSQDSQQLVTTGGDGQIKLWKTNGTLESTLASRGEAVWQATFADQDKTVLAAGEDRQAYLWDLETVLNDDGLIERGCQWIQDYLAANPTIKDRALCPNP